MDKQSYNYKTETKLNVTSNNYKPQIYYKECFGLSNLLIFTVFTPNDLVWIC